MMRPVVRHRSVSSVESEPAVNSRKSGILGTEYPFEAKDAGSRITSAISDMLGCVKVGGRTCGLQLDHTAR